MTRALSWALVALFLSGSTAVGEMAATISTSGNSIVVARNWPLEMPTQPPRMSSECSTRQIAGDAFRRPLRGLRRALRAKREPKVLAVGSSSTVGVGASNPSAAYIAKLETNLEGAFKGLDFEVVGRGMSGEVAEGQSSRMKREIEEHKPDLVVWQVGTNDAIRHVSVEDFKSCLRRTLVWFSEQRIDVVLIDPQYGEKLNADAHYAAIVSALAEVAKDMRVLLVDQFEAMRELAKVRGDGFYLTSDDLHLNDIGHRCMAEQLARAIVSGVLLAETESVQAAHP